MALRNCKNKYISKGIDWKEIMQEQDNFLKPLIQKILQEIMEVEMDDALDAGKSERTLTRLGYRSGYKNRYFITRVGKLELMVPQDRNGLFRTELFERYQRSEKALVSALMEMYVTGVSTRKIKHITEKLCGHEFSAATVSQINKKMDEELSQFANRHLEESYPYLILDARYERVRENGVIRQQAVMIAIGVTENGIREIIGVELQNRESYTSWKEFLIRIKERGLSGVKLIISDNHEGLKKALREVMPEALWQRCYVHFLRNALDYLSKKGDGDCLRELRWLYEQRNIEEAREELKIWLAKWSKKYPKLCNWVEENIEETLTFYNFPKEHHRNLKSTNVIERLNEEIKRRTNVVRIFPNRESCLRLILALAVEIHEQWLESRYLNMDILREKKIEERIVVEEIAA